MGSNPFGKLKSKVDTWSFGWVDVAIALVKEKDLHEGIWRVGLEFDMSGVNVNVGPTTLPAALLPVKRVFLTKEDKMGPMCVDAAVVNPERRIVLAGPTIN